VPEGGPLRLARGEPGRLEEAIALEDRQRRVDRGGERGRVLPAQLDEEGRVAPGDVVYATSTILANFALR